MMSRFFTPAVALLLVGCATCDQFALPSPTRVQVSYDQPQLITRGNGMRAIHGLAFSDDYPNEVLAGSVVGSQLHAVDRRTGKNRIIIDAPEGMSDDIEVGPDGSMYWTAFRTGIVYGRSSPNSEVQVLATGLPGINSLALHPDGRLFATQVFLDDTLYEIDRTGQTPPRLVMRDMGGLNGFDFSRDGLLYGPLWFRGSVVKVNVDTGEITDVATGFSIPSSVNFSADGRLFATDARRGIVTQIHEERGTFHVVAELKAFIDNMAISKTGQLCVSLSADATVHCMSLRQGRVPFTKMTPINTGTLVAPTGVAVSGEDIYVADIFGLKRVSQSGDHKVVQHAFSVEGFAYPAGGMAVDGDKIWSTSFAENAVQRHNVQTGALEWSMHGLPAPVDVIIAGDTVDVLLGGTGEIVRLDVTTHEPKYHVIASGLTNGVSLARLGNGYVVVHTSGQVTIVNVTDGQTELWQIAEGLKQPEGVAILPDGRIAVAETGKDRIVAIAPSGTIETIANIPLGDADVPGLPPGLVPADLAVLPNGDLVVTSDSEPALWRVPILRASQP